MPSREAILNGLAYIANRYVYVAGGWHVAVLVAVLAVAWLGWRPSRRAAILLTSLPLASVAFFAWTTGNPFNGTAFTFLFLASIAFSASASTERVRGAPAWAAALGCASLGYAWIYPHFVESTSLAVRLLASPMGLIPCPTLAMVIGFGLLGSGFGSRGWSVGLGAAGVFYALFGMLRLQVLLDAGLLAAAAGAVALGRAGTSQH